jgi:hypothetical protein
MAPVALPTLAFRVSREKGYGSTKVRLMNAKSTIAPVGQAVLLLSWAIFSSPFSTAFAQVMTFTNPTPAEFDVFGISVAAVGTDRVLIGAQYDDEGGSDAGAAYLFSTNGVLLTTFTNPTPAGFDFFAHSVAAVGTDHVLIGASLAYTSGREAGAAYLFTTDGLLVTTFTNPTPAADDVFGHSVAGIGTDRVLIGAPWDDTGGSDAGAAYLFSTNGSLLTTFTNPTPAVSDEFGWSVATMGTDRVLIGADLDDTGGSDAGAAYLFSTDGTLLTTFTKPTPAVSDGFGFSVATLGADRVLIGAPGDDTGATDAGAAYLFSTNGILLTTFTNPAPAVRDWFGYSVTGVGTERVLIGAASDDTGGANDSGAAFLFSTNGLLLMTFTKPTPADRDWFGISVAAVGTDRVLIGAHLDDTGGSNAGAAYLFSAPSEVLTITLTSTNTAVISWPYPSTGFVLEENSTLETANWTGVTNSVSNDGLFNRVVVPLNTSNSFFRLKKNE